MEDTDRSKIQSLAEGNYELRKLYEEHEAIESELRKFEKKPFLCASDEHKARNLKRAKLEGVDTMMSLLRKGVLS